MPQDIAAESDQLAIAGVALRSRLFVGSALYPNRQVMLDALAASGAELVTASIRRIDLAGGAESLIDDLAGYRLLPNTAGCTTARDAVLTAQLAREALGTDWVKLELIGDRQTLYPDVAQLLEAAAVLVADGFVVLPYCNEDPVTCRKLADLGCAAVMPLGSFIGSGQGIQNPRAIEHVARASPVPVILDAGIGTASHAAQAMELGCAGVLVNTAIARARDPVAMARAMKLGVAAGRTAFAAGRVPERRYAEPSSPQLGLIGS
jgi:thiazole synthase